MELIPIISNILIFGGLLLAAVITLTARKAQKVNSEMVTEAKKIDIREYSRKLRENMEYESERKKTPNLQVYLPLNPNFTQNTINKKRSREKTLEIKNFPERFTVVNNFRSVS